MQEYKPKRFEIHNHTEHNSWQRSFGFSFARERYNLTKDWYININLWWFGMTIVLLRSLELRPHRFNR